MNKTIQDIYGGGSDGGWEAEQIPRMIITGEEVIEESEEEERK